MIVLIFAGTKTLLKGRRLYAMESERVSDVQDSVKDPLNTVLLSGAGLRQSFTKEDTDQEFRTSESLVGKSLIQPWRSMRAIACTWVIYTIIFAIASFKSIVPKCSPPYVVLLVIVFVPLLAQLLWGLHYATRYAETVTTGSIL